MALEDTTLMRWGIRVCVALKPCEGLGVYSETTAVTGFCGSWTCVLKGSQWWGAVKKSLLKEQKEADGKRRWHMQVVVDQMVETAAMVRSSLHKWKVRPSTAGGQMGM